jgi:hypothetical protein
VVDEAARDEEQAVLVPVAADQDVDVGPRARSDRVAGQHRQHGAVDHGLERHAVQHELAPPGGVGGRPHLAGQGALGLDERVERHRGQALAGERDLQPLGKVPGDGAGGLGPQREVAGSALQDRAAEQPARAVHRHQAGRAHGARRLAGDRHLVGVPPEGGDVVAHPLERRDLVEQPAVLRSAVAEQQEAVGAEPVVDRHRDDAVPGEGRPVVHRHGAGPEHEGAAVDPHQHGQAGGVRVGRPDVEVEDLLARDDRLGQQPVQRRRVDALHGRRAEGRRVAHVRSTARGEPERRSGGRRTAAPRTGCPGTRRPARWAAPARCRTWS